MGNHNVYVLELTQGERMSDNNLRRLKDPV